MKRILVCGGRDYCDMKRVVIELQKVVELNSVIIHGGARGADSLASQFAYEGNFDEQVYRAKWAYDGKSAGPIRNSRMLKESKPDVVVAFPGGKGTSHMVKIAKDAGIPVIEVK